MYHLSAGASDLFHLYTCRAAKASSGWSPCDRPWGSLFSRDSLMPRPVGHESCPPLGRLVSYRKCSVSVFLVRSVNLRLGARPSHLLDLGMVPRLQRHESSRMSAGTGGFRLWGLSETQPTPLPTSALKGPGFTGGPTGQHYHHSCRVHHYRLVGAVRLISTITP